MIKLIIFDLDGVLVDARDIHYHALNKALVDCGYKPIDRDIHLSTFDGLTTSTKLYNLAATGWIKLIDKQKIWKAKQNATIEVIKETIKPNLALQQTLSILKAEGFRIACASNSIYKSVQTMLVQLGINQYFDAIYSNEHVKNPKPHPEVYMRVMLENGIIASPKETLIVEDSHIGRKGAVESGAHLLGVISPADVTYENIRGRIDEINKKDIHFQPKWQGGRMNVLIPMAGAGSRFEQAGYTFPKPLIDVEGKPMIQVVTENLNIDAHHIYIVQKSHYEKYNLSHVLRLISPGCSIVQVDGVTEGAACTALLAKEFIDNDDPLVIANSDQYVEWNSNEFLYAMQSEGVDAGILTFDNTHPKWSYARLDEKGWVIEVAEKKPISRHATVGIYYWKMGNQFVWSAEEMIKANDRVNGEFYVCPTFNHLLSQPYVRIKPYHIDRMWGLGTPEDLQVFLGRNK